MSRRNEQPNANGSRIQAKQFDTPPPAGSGVGQQSASVDTPNLNARWWHSQLNLLLAVFALLAIAALLFIQLAPPPSTTELAPQAVRQNTGVVVDNAEQAPWDESRRAQARTDSQDILSNLLQSKSKLEAIGVQQWAPSEFAQALAMAEAGDTFYKAQDYPPAIQSYQSALDQIDRLFEEVPNLVNNSIAVGNQAIEQGKSALAQQAFNKALQLDENSIPAMNGLERANNLDQVLLLVQNALQQEQQFKQDDKFEHLQTAQQFLDDAAKLDPSYPAISEAKMRISDLQNDKQFRSAMSKGFAALFRSRYGSANKAFSEALKIKPNDKMASNAYRQSIASTKTSSVQSVLDRAASFEASEDWQNALSNYELALQRDANLVAAKLGQIRSRARAQLDAQLRGLLADTLSLSKKGKSADAQRLLQEARAIANKGPKLERQISELERGVQTAVLEIVVQLQSDALSEISLQKVGARNIALGRFNNKKLSLKPGRYVLSAVRLGFKDVRKEIELSPVNGRSQKFSISCEKAIGAVFESSVNGDNDEPA